MTTPAQVPAAARFRRPGWRDPRLLGGVLIVALSLAVGSWAVSDAGGTTGVLVASEVLTPGDPVTVDDLRLVQVRLPADQADRYLRPDAVAEGSVVRRTVGAGELVPRDAVDTSADDGVRPVALRVPGALSDRVAEGRLVDVWFVPAQEPGAGGPVEPRRLVEGATVDAVESEDGAFVEGGVTTVHVLVDVDSLPDVLAAVAASGTVSVLPAGGAVS